MGVIGIFLLTVVLGLVISFYFSKKQRERRRIAKYIDHFGGDTRYPIIGTALNVITASREDLFETLDKRNVKYGPVFRTWLGSLPSVHVMKPQHAEIILKSNENLQKGTFYTYIQPWLGEGLITNSNPEKWFRHRKMLTPSFHFKILDSFNDVFSEKSQKLAHKLLPKANGEFFDIYPYLTHCMLDIICETAMGTELNAMDHSDSPYVQAVNGITDIVTHRIFHPYLHPDFIFNLTKNGRMQKEHLAVLHGFTRKVIRDKQAQLDQNDNVQELTEEEKLMGKKKRLAFLDLLLQANKNNAQLTDEEIREEVDTFMFAGHDTTTATTSWTLFTLGNYPEVQAKVHQELDELFHGDVDGPITPEHLAELKYLERVIKETLRMYPIVTTIARTLTKEIEIDGHPIPPGVMLIVQITNLHKDPEQYPDPERFDPDRFLPERAAQRHPYSFIPFSAGPRNCLGQKFAMRNAKTLLAAILRKYTVKAFNTPANIKFYSEVVTRPQNGMIVALEPRKKQ